MLHTLVDGIVMVDIKGQIIYANKAAEKILGVGKDILGKYFQSREWRQIDENGNPYPLDKLPLSIVLRDHKPVQNLVHKLIAQDEECICISVNAAPLFDETGNFFGGIASFRDITAQKDIEQQLRESEQRNRLIVENINLGVFISNLEGKFILANTAIARITGYDSIKEILNIPSSSLYADQADRESVIKKLKESGSVKNMELLFMKKGGTTFWISLNAVLINEDDGSPRGIIGFIDDITERKIAAEKIKSQNEQLNKANKELLSLNLFLQESKKKYQQIVETAIEGMISIDSDSRITFISKQMSGMLGYTIEEMLGKKFESFIYDDQIPDHYEQMKLRAQGKDSIYERCIKRKDGERQWTLISGKSIIDSNGNFEGSFAMITDINELKKTENELKQKTEFLKYITDNMYDLVSLTDLKGIYTFVGKSHSILGYDPDFLIGKNVLDFVHPDDLPFISKEFYTKLALNENSQAEYRYKCKDGSYLWFETIGKILTDENNKQEKILFSTRNITDRKNAEYNIQKLLSEKDLILKEVHHRIKNNMSTIYGLLYLQAGSLKDQKAIEALEDAANRVQSMMVLYDKLYKSPDFQKISLADYLPALVDEISSNFHNSKSVKIEKQVEDFNLDAKRLQTIGIIINELITNIMKYAFIGKNDGLITIGAHLIKSDIDNQSIVSIEIKDNGNGLPESVDFENSTGFGLKLVWLLVKELNGSISINRQNGTRFMLDFKL
jgi:PAS domain S-box-containing protein